MVGLEYEVKKLSLDAVQDRISGLDLSQMYHAYTDKEYIKKL